MLISRPKEFEVVQEDEGKGGTNIDDMMPPSESSGEEDEEEEREETQWIVVIVFILLNKTMMRFSIRFVWNLVDNCIVVLIGFLLSIVFCRSEKRLDTKYRIYYCLAPIDYMNRQVNIMR